MDLVDVQDATPLMSEAFLSGGFVGVPHPQDINPQTELRRNKRLKTHLVYEIFASIVRPGADSFYRRP
jgi:hypothetical protein